MIVKNTADGCTKEYAEDMEKKYAIMLQTGLHISEAIGLTWNDVDMVDRIINVNHQVQYRKVKDTMELYANDTKTNAGNRAIPMTDEVYDLFVEQKKVWLMTKKEPDFEVDGYKDFVFISHMTGKCMNHNNVRRMMRTIVDMNSEREYNCPI